MVTNNIFTQRRKGAKEKRRKYILPQRSQRTQRKLDWRLELEEDLEPQINTDERGLMIMNILA
jgi:hypothetical protein